MKKIKITLFSVGIILLLINFAGLFMPLRSPALNEAVTFFEEDLILSEKETLGIIQSDKFKTKKEYVSAINDAINRGILHYWNKENIDKYNIRIPIYENYILYGLGFISPPIFEMYEYCGWRKGIERGLGFCSQHAIIATGILEERNIPAKIIYLGGHVILTAEVNSSNNEWWLIDPDYGVIIKRDIETALQNQDEIVQHYRDKGFKDEVILAIANIYKNAPSNYILFENGVKSYPDCNWKKYYIEKISYILIWIIPLLLIMPFMYLLIRKK